MSEHKRLINLMENSKSPKMLAEAKRQKAEVAAMLKKRTGARM